MQFAGALAAQKANKGIFITTSRFTDDARSYVSQIGSKIVLVDGELLTNLMIDSDIGVSTVSVYLVKKLIQIISMRVFNNFFNPVSTENLKALQRAKA